MTPGYYWAKTDIDEDWEIVEVVIEWARPKVYLLGNDKSFSTSIIAEWGHRISADPDGQTRTHTDHVDKLNL